MALLLATLVVGCGGARSGESSTSTSKAESAASTSATRSTTSVGVPSRAAYWPYAKLVANLAGRTLVLPRGPVRLDTALLECNGDGAALQMGPSRGWSRYTCTQTLFEGGIDRDVTFDVAILSPTQLRITSQHYGPE